jgi:hypothetical protein
MPWPQNSRTTENPCFSAWPWIAAYAEPHAFERHLDQPFGLDARLADVEHAAAVAVVAVLDHGDVDIQDIACLEHAVARHAVADLVVHRGADRFRVRAVARRGVIERRRDRALHLHHVAVAQIVQLSGRDAGANVRGDEIEDLGSEPAGDAHALQLFRALQEHGH